MTQAYNLALLANNVNTSGQLNASTGLYNTTALGFPAGTLMLFQQTSAPTGWTKDTTHNNKALRVVSGSASSGGSVGFTTAFGTPTVNTASLSADATTLSASQIPSHNHSVNAYGWSPWESASLYGTLQGGCGMYLRSLTNNTGGGGSHSHSISGSATVTINVSYVDLIIASKD